MNTDLRPIILWFRRDLRLAASPAVRAALETGAPVIPVYVHDPDYDGRPRGSASLWRLGQSLAALEQDLAGLGARLIVRRGAAEPEILSLAEQAGASTLVMSALFTPTAETRDKALAGALKAKGVTVRRFNSSLLHTPGRLLTQGGAPFQVYSPFARSFRQMLSASPLSENGGSPKSWPKWAGQDDIESLPLDSLKLSPKSPNWAAGFPQIAGAAAALETFKSFIDGPLETYAKNRDTLSLEASSSLSDALHFGEISPHTLLAELGRRQAGGAAADKFISELIWREFSYSILEAYPHLCSENIRSKFDGLAWRDDPEGLAAWQAGRTGYPVVDAAMRQLWQTGKMHNRARMITASFLTKHLQIDWRLGERWFYDCLLDADPALNPFNWQWVAGCGVDAAPYFRIFNPILQGEKYDPDGAYVRRFVPELARLPKAFIHKPWKAAPSVLADAGVRLGVTYPHPMVDHDQARRRALEAFSGLKDQDAQFSL